MSDLPRDYDPDPHDRVWYRRASDGQLGWMVRRRGIDYIRLDRPQQEILQPYRPSDWIKEDEHRPLTVAQIAQVAWEADRALLRFMGDHERSQREWVSMRDSFRREWIEQGPQDVLARKKLYRAIMVAMEDMAR